MACIREWIRGNRIFRSALWRPTMTILILAWSATATAGQVSTFDLSGTVRDEQGGVLPGVDVTIRNEVTGASRTVATDQSGNYYFPALPPQGTWELAFELAGFTTHRRPGLRFSANTKPVINVTMTIGGLEESVTVVRESPLLDTGQAMLAVSVSTEQIQELPLVGRDFLDLALMGSGVTDVATGAVIGSQSQTISGVYSRYTSYQLDGFNNTRDQHGVQKADVSLDAISEFSVLTNQFSAEYGQSMAGIVSVITKSGTNELSGTGFLFVRPGAWDERDTLTGRKAPFNRQDFGFTLGGPIARDRTHFFTSFEYRNQDEEAVVTATLGDGRFQGAFPLESERLRVLGKVNHQFTRNHFDVTFILGEETARDGIGGLTVADGIRTNINDDITVQGTYSSILSDSMLNEVKLAYSKEDYSSERTASTLTPTGVGLTYPGQGILPGYFLQTAPDTMFQVANIFTRHANQHATKFGGSVYSSTPGGVLFANLEGTYVFAPGAPFPYDPNNPASWPVRYDQGFFGEGGSPELELDEWHIAVFLQDDWKIRDNLTLNAGLRYQVETSVPDWNNLAPRLGFAWDPYGNSRMVLRGGFGIFHNTIFSAIDAFEAFQNPNGFRSVSFVPGDPLFPDYPNSLPGPTLPAGVQPPPGEAYVEAAEYAESRRRAPESRNFTFGVERQLLANLSASVDVMYNLGRNLVVPTDLNAPSFFDYTTGARRTAQAADLTRPFGVPGSPIPAGVFDFMPDGYPFDGYRSLYLLESVGESEYTAVRLAVTRRFANRFSLQGHYTWSRMINIGDDFRPGNSLPLDPNDREAERARAATDIPHSFSLNGIVRLPWDIQVAGIIRARSGEPVDPRVGFDLNGDRNTRERPFANGRIFTRNSFRTPAFATADMSLTKAVTVSGVEFQGRFEVFNLTNRLNVSSVNNIWGTDGGTPAPNFLMPTQAYPPRRFQVAVRAMF